MAVAFVQSNTVSGGGGTSPLTCAFLSNNTAGNFIVVLAAANNGTANITVTDTTANSYTGLPKIITPDSTYEAQVFVAANIAGGANTVQMEQDGTGGTDLLIYEFSGVSKLSAGSVGNGAGNSEDSRSITAHVGDLLLGVMAGTSVATGTELAGTGWTGLVRSGGTVAILAEYQIVASDGTYNATFTTTAGKGGLNTWVAQILTSGAIAAGSARHSALGDFGNLWTHL